MQELINKYFYFNYLAQHTKSYFQRVYFLSKRDKIAEWIDEWYSPEEN